MTTEHSNDPTLPPPGPPEAGIADPLIRITTALAVASVAAVAAVISYRHAYELVTTHGETGLTARLLPLTVDGLILAASMLMLDASRRQRRVPPSRPPGCSSRAASGPTRGRRVDARTSRGCPRAVPFAVPRRGKKHRSSLGGRRGSWSIVSSARDLFRGSRTVQPLRLRFRCS
jgi:Protein of unknown function (DUF2637)